MQVAATRSDRRRIRNRDAILTAAETLFGARGIDAVSIDEIALAADIAKGTIYNHFTDKDALAGEIARAARDDGEARVAAANAGVADPVRRTVRGLLVFAHFAWERPERTRAMMRLTPSATDPTAAVNRGLLNDITEAAQTGAFRVEREAGTLHVLGVAHALISRLINQPQTREAAEAMARASAALTLRALGLAHDQADDIAAAEAAEIFKGAAS